MSSNAVQCQRKHVDTNKGLTAKTLPHDLGCALASEKKPSRPSESISIKRSAVIQALISAPSRATPSGPASPLAAPPPPPVAVKPPSSWNPPPARTCVRGGPRLQGAPTAAPPPPRPFPPPAHPPRSFSSAMSPTRTVATCGTRSASAAATSSRPLKTRGAAGGGGEAPPTVPPPPSMDGWGVEGEGGWRVARRQNRREAEGEKQAMGGEGAGQSGGACGAAAG